MLAEVFAPSRIRTERFQRGAMISLCLWVKNYARFCPLGSPPLSEGYDRV